MYWKLNWNGTHKICRFINNYEIFLCNITVSHEIIFERKNVYFYSQIKIFYYIIFYILYIILYFSIFKSNLITINDNHLTSNKTSSQSFVWIFNKFIPEPSDQSMGAKSPKNKEARKLLIKEILWKKYLKIIDLI